MRVWSMIAVAVSMLAVGAWLGTGTAQATMQIQKKAKQAGSPAQSCLYCHQVKLPRKEDHPHNERGQWLLAEKERRKAKEVDPAWLKNYVEAGP